jgi:hypothetical protein
LEILLHLSCKSVGIRSNCAAAAFVLSPGRLQYNAKNIAASREGGFRSIGKRKKLPIPDSSALVHEWTTLQNNHEQYERSSLQIKLGSIALFVACIALSLDAAIVLVLMAILWLQEAISRTSQSRLGERILRIEQLLRDHAQDAAPACQLHSEWLAARPGFAGLLAEYGKNMLRPTVAFPYAALMGATMVWFALG